MLHVIRRMDRKKWIQGFIFRELLWFTYFLMRALSDYSQSSRSPGGSNLWALHAFMVVAIFVAMVIRVLKPPSRVLEFDEKEVRVFSRFGSPISIPRAAFKMARIATFEDAVNDGDFLGGLAFETNSDDLKGISKLPTFQYHVGPTNTLIINPSFMAGAPSDWAKVFNDSCSPEP